MKIKGLSMDYELVKIIVIGDSCVGKTSFINRYVNGGFRGDYKSTIGVDFAIKHAYTSAHQNVKLQLWDIAGQDRYTHLCRAYYKDAKGCVLMFDVTRKPSFNSVRKWKADLDAKLTQQSGVTLPCLLVANKSDQSPHAVSDDEIQEACGELMFEGWTKTSVKDGTMVTETMNLLMDIITRVTAAAPPCILTDSICLGPPEDYNDNDELTEEGDEKKKSSKKTRRRCAC